MAALLNKSALVAKPMAGRAAKPARVSTVVVRASAEVDRRAALGMIAGAATLLSGAAPSLAAFGDSANVFGRVTNKSGFVPYAGENYALLLPAKWNPSPEREFPGVELRYQDNGDAVNNLVVIVNKTDKKSVEDFGTPEKFLEQYSFLLGKQSYSGETQSEGGFAPNRVSAASLLDVSSEKDKKGKTYYTFQILTRTADGDEGGRHQLIKATVSNGNLYLMKIQAGDKRWFKGADKDCKQALESFTVA
eukprot:CAMPEP_0202857334 /NCGR_PEP_ID=MMETSP1391-20130828/314_1 /ASSEMBLY_ACC=CAM_ASM_000867 /TAXON_ID=1034604 /ORGANISM="Chlamydomonas leiostraca, Strain SAG 11-49" /LENGTH=247 /DNA_ID=CAMNT_0049536125 /DNA_START=14 /DNA_END=757 /DNA_ORIENTATION=+